MVCENESVKYQDLALSKAMLNVNVLIHFAWQCMVPNFGTTGTPPMLLRYCIPPGGNVPGAWMDYLLTAGAAYIRVFISTLSTR